MSRTDKTRPWWVIEFFEGVVEHDHRHGPCQVATVDDLRQGRRARCRPYLWRPIPISRHEVYSTYHHPMRRSARDALTRARAEYRAGHEPRDEWEPPILAQRSVW